MSSIKATFLQEEKHTNESLDYRETLSQNHRLNDDVIVENISWPVVTEFQPIERYSVTIDSECNRVAPGVFFLGSF